MGRTPENEIENVILMRTTHPKESGDLSFMGRVLVQMTLPHSDPGDTESFVRYNGKQKLIVQAAPDLGLPYGAIPRLILAWLTTEVKNTKSREVRLGRSLSNFMKELGFDPRGGERGNINPVKEQTARLFGSRMSAVQNDETGYQMKDVRLAKDLRVFWDVEGGEAGSADGQEDLFDSRVVLDDDFFHMLLDRPAPVDARALRSLRNSAMALDLYMFLTYRVSYMRQEIAISWDQLERQFGASYEETRRFAEAARKQLKRIKGLWPGLDYETPYGRLLLKPSSKPHVPHDRRTFPAGR